MSDSTPADLAVAFRSLARRQREAIGDANPASLSGAIAEVQSHVAAAAALMRTSADADSVATAIEARHPDDWDDATLNTLRQEALAAGAALRRLAAAAGADDD
jgi:hypothetical protein